MTKSLYDLTDEQIRRASNLYNMKIEEKIRKGEFLRGSVEVLPSYRSKDLEGD